MAIKMADTKYIGKRVYKTTRTKCRRLVAVKLKYNSQIIL